MAIVRGRFYPELHERVLEELPALLAIAEPHEPGDTPPDQLIVTSTRLVMCNHGDALPSPATVALRVMFVASHRDDRQGDRRPLVFHQIPRADLGEVTVDSPTQITLRSRSGVAFAVRVADAAACADRLARWGQGAELDPAPLPTARLIEH